MEQDGFHIVTAPPGAGKSWDLTCLGEELASDYVVARHYCYLEPGDELIERRVTTDVFFANIISELHEADSEINLGSTRLSADLRTLEETLARSVELGKRIVLIIDGLDHISRVKSSSNVLSDDETDIVERLSTLKIPKGVKLIIGSQPGDHLQPTLSKLHGVVQTLKLVGISNDCR
ncbi:AAA family ATPase [Moritella viscosa]